MFEWAYVGTSSFPSSSVTGAVSIALASTPTMLAPCLPTRFDLSLGLLPRISRCAPATLSIALLTSSDFGKTEIPVMNTLQLRRATNAPDRARTHQTLP